jgi:uncharacterized protein
LDSRLALPANTSLGSSYRIVRLVGSGGFGITYEAEDVSLHTTVAIKEYYPIEFGDRDATMSVRPKSDRHKHTFEWGRSNFLQEARTLARFEHPSIVRVLHVFEVNSTAYMVMRFEQGKNFEVWLTDLGRPPTQEELDRIAAPLLDALELMHAESFLHRDIAPDNILVRADGTPVLLDFGTARRAVAEMSRALTGIVKAGYSPQEQYASDGRLQGPWSDLYALGGTLYRAVTGRPPEESTLRAIEDRMVPAAQAALASYRPGFLAAIDACLQVRHAQRPRSVAQVRPMLLEQGPQPAPSVKRSGVERTTLIEASQPAPVASDSASVAQRWPIVAVMLVALIGAAGGIAYDVYGRWKEEARRRQAIDAQVAAERAADELARRQADAKRKADEERTAAERRATDEKAQRVAQAENDFREGERYLYGRGVTIDYARAREAFEKAANADHSGGMAGLGWLNQSGKGLPRDYAKAREWYEKAAARGNSAGMANLAWLHRDGLGVPRDYAKAREWYEKSAAAGNSVAMLNVGWLHHNGFGVARDYDKAREWYEKAAAKGNSAGMANIGSIYRDGLGVARDYGKAREWYEKAAAAGNGGAMISLGWLYHTGRGVARDYDKAREWYEKAAATGNGVGMANVGWLYRDGLGVARDFGKAREWFEKAVTAGSGAGMNGLGVLYQNGDGVPKDYDKAREWFEKAAATGETFAMNNLGRLHQNGWGVAQDYAKAREWFEKGATAGNGSAKVSLATLLDQGRGGPADYPRAAKLLLESARAGNTFATEELRGPMTRWARGTRAELKRELARLGHHSGPATDDWDNDAKAAVGKYLASPR